MNINDERKTMNNIKKVGLSALAGSLAMVSAHAVEYSVSGDAQAVYSSAQGNDPENEAKNGKGIGSDNDITFSGSGELAATINPCPAWLRWRETCRTNCRDSPIRQALL